MKLKCVAIDDEPLALRQINSYIERIETLELCASWSDPKRALEYLRACEMHLVFVDINMPGIDGLELVEMLEGRHMVIFTTAYSEYAIDGFRLDAVDYLLKPFSFALFEKAVQKAISLYELYQMRDNVQNDAQSAQANNSGYITVKSDYKAVPIKISDITYIESVGEYVRMHLRDAQSITTFYRLKNMEADLPSTQFVRIHRSYIINMADVASYSRVRVQLNGEVELPIGDSYRENFISAIEQYTK